jgi:hypothetical protein
LQLWAVAQPPITFYGWLMEAAVATSCLALSGTFTPEAMTYFSFDNLARLS